MSRSKTPAVPAEQQTGRARSIRRVAAASLIGSALEWYDFFLYGTAAALVLNKLFFPATNPTIGTLAAFATFAVGFVARPVGGVIFGHFGDRVGRKAMLVITLVIMGASTALIGVLPTYHQVGMLAPVLLVIVRIAQGIAVGGEWGGAVLLISEQSTSKRRGFYSAFSQTGVTLGFVVSAAVFAAFGALPQDAFMAWGWRLPFLLSIVLVTVGLLIRTRIAETPEFEQAKKSAEQRPHLPVVQVLKEQYRSVLLVIGARMAENGGSYVLLVFSLAYGTRIGISTGVMLTAVIIANIVETATIVGFGALSDRIGRRPVYLLGAGGLVLWAFPFFWLLNTKNPLLVCVAVIVAVGVCHGAMIGTQPSFFTELFTTKVRYSGLALGHEVSGVFAGGFAPFIATALLAWQGSYWPVALYLAALGVLSVLAVALAPETVGRARRRRREDIKQR
ncbi:MFS transporter [Amycolatopsis orientalis]|uniref:MFS transporter n=1 Tax=Amycolatopsis orientalis TaxID=31958 RepID=UPI001F1735CA|nr:MFS transporter [Amycolatopsis orientalis]